MSTGMRKMLITKAPKSTSGLSFYISPLIHTFLTIFPLVLSENKKMGVNFGCKKIFLVFHKKQTLNLNVKLSYDKFHYQGGKSKR